MPCNGDFKKVWMDKNWNIFLLIGAHCHNVNLEKVLYAMLCIKPKICLNGFGFHLPYFKLLLVTGYVIPDRSGLRKSG